ncbi:MAG: hypothetical protein HY077_07150 [Elusimicrobia bacterium]|nr:hypothetical protein [Elusimicrobiota bacterium]
MVYFLVSMVALALTSIFVLAEDALPFARARRKKFARKSYLEKLLELLPPVVGRRLLGLDREEQAEEALKSALADWATAGRTSLTDQTRPDREQKTSAQGKAMAALTYLPAERLIALVGETPLSWLRKRAVELLERRALSVPQLVRLWSAAGGDPALIEGLGRLAASRLHERTLPPDIPVELLAAAVDSGDAQPQVVEALIERRPPPLERLLWYLHRDGTNSRLLAHARARLPDCDLPSLARLKAGLGEDSALSSELDAALSSAASRLPPPELSRAAEDYPELAGVVVAEIVRRLGHLCSPITLKHSDRGGRPRVRDEERLRELGERLLAHARPEEAEKLIDEILSLELRRSRAGLAPVCARDVAAMLCRYPTGVVGAQAAKALGLFATRAAIEPLAEAASSLDENIRLKALDAISAINERASRPASRRKH